MATTASATPGFLADWRRSLPLRLRGLVLPYGRALGVFVAGYAGATALFEPWALGRWWGFGVCWGLWRPWALLARNHKGETRRLPLLFVWMLLIAVGWNTREYLRYRLGDVRDVGNVRELARPGEAVFFRLHGPCYPAKADLGRHAAWEVRKEKNGTQTYFAAAYYACPLLADAADTTDILVTPPAWLAYTYQTQLGANLPPGERNWRYLNFVARADARLDSLNLTAFTYLLREEHPGPGLYQAVQASRLAPTTGTALLLMPVQAPFAARGGNSRRLVLWLTLIGSAFVVFLLCVMPLRPAGERADE